MTGRAFVFGDNIDTDQLAPGKYMSGGVEILAEHVLEDLRPDFASSFKPGDVIVAGRNFGMGSSREQAAEALKILGAAAVIANSFAGIFYRNAINLGLPVLTSEDLSAIEDGDSIDFDLENSRLRLPEKAAEIALEPLPGNLRQMLKDGGLVPHLKKRFAAERKERNP
jgi:3-isopropylmalate/(R)-2-methylmalate dehydratase small subunit